ncbi:MAG: agmatinase [Cellulosilyticaceae bacterium]
MPSNTEFSSKFMGFENSYESAEVILVGAPFDGTTSNRPGTRFAPNQIRIDSYGLETYSPYLNQDLEDYSLCDIGDISLPFGNTKKALDAIGFTAKEIINSHKRPLVLGGEHLISLPIVKALYEKYPDLIILHFDAHTDLRADYLGELLSHATVLRRIWDIVGDNRIFQFGIRSGTRDEFIWAKEHTHLEKFTADTFKSVVSNLKNKPVYLTIDLDVLDPSIFPGTGTPEPGGLSFHALLDCLQNMVSLTLVGADIVELSPHYDATAVSTAVACKVTREVALLLANSH